MDITIIYMNLTHKSQSALEYMMTYGWAILIIVIVAVILYSMGIFNPSSSITFTSSGFSPFTVSSSLCNNLGYKIAVLAGPIPNNANSLTISKVYLTSATGANSTTASYKLTNPVTLKSGQSATILIPNVACNAANVHYSISANIQYSYTASTLGLQTVNTTGTVAGTSISGKPSVLTTYEPVTITNSQSSATPNPFQQMVVFNSTDPGFSSISTGNFGQNVEFFYYNGTVIPSWLQNYTADNATWWLNIAAIPAGSSETVYVGFAPTSTNLFNTVNDGEAPQIPCIEEGVTNTSKCSVYAEYDDGEYVFNYYVNYAGSSLPPGSSFTGTKLIINNGMTLISNISSSSRFNLPIYFTPRHAYITDANFNEESTYYKLGGDESAIGLRNEPYQIYFGRYLGDSQVVTYRNSSVDNHINVSFPIHSYSIFTINVVSTNKIAYSLNNKLIITGNITEPYASGLVYGYYEQSQSTANITSYYFAETNSASLMPTYAFSSIS